MLGVGLCGGCSLAGKLCEEFVGICCQLDDAVVFVSSSLVRAAVIINTCEVLAMDSSRNSSRGPVSVCGVSLMVSQCCCVGAVGCEGEGAEPE